MNQIVAQESEIVGGGFVPLPQERNAATEALVSRQAQEVQAAMVIAKRFPRDEIAAYNRIMQACRRPKLAEEAEYEFPRGGTKVTGPSIRLAEVLAQCWGNVDYGIVELENKLGESQVMAYAWDLETNTRHSVVFTVKHERKAQGMIKRLDDPRDIYEMVANHGARRVRSCILRIIPGDIVEAAIEECRKTLQNAYKEPLQDRIRKMIVAFHSDFQVTQAMLEKYIGCKADAFSENDFIRLRNVYKALRDGMAKREDYFDLRAGEDAPAAASKTEEAFRKQQEQKQNGRAKKQAEEPPKKSEGEGQAVLNDDLLFEDSD